MDLLIFVIIIVAVVVGIYFYFRFTDAWKKKEDMREDRDIRAAMTKYLSKEYGLNLLDWKFEGGETYIPLTKDRLRNEEARRVSLKFNDGHDDTIHLKMQILNDTLAFEIMEKIEKEEKRALETAKKAERVKDAEVKNDLARITTAPVFEGLSKLLVLSDELESASDNRRKAKYFEKITNDEAYEKLIGEFGPLQDENVDEFNYYGVIETDMKEFDSHLMSSAVCLDAMIECAENQSLVGEIDKMWNKFEKKKYAIPYPITQDKLDLLAEARDSVLKLCHIAKEDDDSYKAVASDYDSMKKGHDGEKAVEEYLKSVALPEWKMFNNAVLPVIPPIEKNGKKIENFENDSIVITEYGIFTLEVKNYETGKLVIGKDGKEKRLDDEGVEYTKEEDKEKRSMIEQCEEHVNFLVKLFNANGRGDLAYKVHGIVVIANDNIDLEYNGDYPIVRIGNLRHEFFKEKYQKEKLDINGIAEIITKNLRKENKYEHVIPKLMLNREERNEIKYNLSHLLTLVASRIENGSSFTYIEKYDPHPVIKYSGDGRDGKYQSVAENGFRINISNRAFRPAGSPDRIYPMRSFTEKEERRNTFKFPRPMSKEWAVRFEEFFKDSDDLGNTEQSSEHGDV